MLVFRAGFKKSEYEARFPKPYLVTCISTLKFIDRYMGIV